MVKEANRKEVEFFLKKYFPKYTTTYDPFEKIFIYEKKELIGVISISIIYERAEINYIVVDEENRRNKIGTKLLEYALNYMKNKKISIISLEVNTNNVPAIKLYEKYGFKIKTVRKNYYGHDDGYLMTKELR